MVEVTEADRIAAAQLIENYWHGDPSKAGNGMRRLAQSYRNGHTQGVWATAFATHREAAAKAERDRLLKILKQCAEGSAFMEALVAKFEAVLEKQP